jgi:hypothetical protein
MPQVLTTNAVIVCPHGGLGTTTPSRPLWQVNGGFVVVEGDVGVLSCPFIPYPCVGYRLRSMGLNATQIQGQKVMLVTDFNQSFTGLPLQMTEAHSTKDDSTPAPLPAGGTAPPLPPALADLVAPIVTGVMPVTQFSLSTNQPATVAATFTLTSAFALKWVLTRISEPPPGANEDLTNGNPPNATVVPAGGNWTASPLTVTWTMTALYMAGLGLGKHHFFMTGVSQRGLSGYAQVALTVGS